MGAAPSYNVALLFQNSASLNLFPHHRNKRAFAPGLLSHRIPQGLLQGPAQLVLPERPGKSETLGWEMPLSPPKEAKPGWNYETASMSLHQQDRRAGDSQTISVQLKQTRLAAKAAGTIGMFLSTPEGGSAVELRRCGWKRKGHYRSPQEFPSTLWSPNQMPTTRSL